MHSTFDLDRIQNSIRCELHPQSAMDGRIETQGAAIIRGPL